MAKFICIPICDHISDDEAYEFAQEINRCFQPHHDAIVAKADRLPDDAILAQAANDLGIDWPPRKENA